MSLPFDAPAPGSAFATLAEAAMALGAQEIVTEVRDLASRVLEGRFHLACVGQFKRGKSTLANALIGDPCLPTGVAPVTSVVTVLRHGRKKTAQVRLAGEGWRAIDPGTLADYVTESGNPGNGKRVEAVEVRLPSALLDHGMSLVDTPGIGSVFESGSLATRRFVPHIDAALIVLGADPPISGEELRLVMDVARNVRELIFVLNKADRLPRSDRAEALAFTRRVLAEHLRQPIDTIHEISATDVLDGRGAEWDWGGLVNRTTSLARESGAELVRGAERRGRAYLAGRLRREIAAQRAAILRPLEQSEARVELVRRSVEDAERWLQDLSYLLNAEHDRLTAALRARQRSFLDSAMPGAIAEFRREFSRMEQGGKARLREGAVSLSRELWHRWLERWRKEQQPLAEAEYRQAADRFIELGNGFLARLKSARLEELPAALPPEPGFRAKSRFFYTDLLDRGPFTAGTWILDRVRTRRATRHAVEGAVAEHLEELFLTNTARIVNELIEQALESRRRLEAELRAQIRSGFTTAERALSRARAMQADGRAAVEAEVARLDALAERLRTAGGPGEGEEGS